MVNHEMAGMIKYLKCIRIANSLKRGISTLLCLPGQGTVTLTVAVVMPIIIHFRSASAPRPSSVIILMGLHRSHLGSI